MEREVMSHNQQSAHVEVGLVLTQVRSEFLRASTSDPQGPARAAKALRRGFELLNCFACCYRCRPCRDSAAGERCEDCVTKKQTPLPEASNVAGERSGTFCGLLWVCGCNLSNGSTAVVPPHCGD